MKIRIYRNNIKNNELITGDDEGRVVIWNLKNGKSIYLWEAHKGAITQMRIESEKNLLWTGGKDLTIRVWRFPEKWISSKVKVFKENEIPKITSKLEEEKIQKIKNNLEIDSDEDYLNGWYFRIY